MTITMITQQNLLSQTYRQQAYLAHQLAHRAHRLMFVPAALFTLRQRSHSFRTSCSSAVLIAPFAFASVVMAYLCLTNPHHLHCQVHVFINIAEFPTIMLHMHLCSTCCPLSDDRAHGPMSPTRSKKCMSRPAHDGREVQCANL